MKNKNPSPDFDLATAREMCDAFAYTSGLACSVCTSSGETVHSRRSAGWDCAFCKKLSARIGLQSGCETLHSYGAFQSERFGGRYIYFCPLGLSFTASPIMYRGRFAGAVVGGPVLISDPEDILESEAVLASKLDEKALTELRSALAAAVRLTPKRLGHVSRQMFATAVCISDSSQELFSSLQENRRQNYIGEYISRLKSGDAHPGYPVDKERELSAAIASGDKAAAGEKLNEILGHIFFYISDPQEANARIEELFVVLGRAAVSGGANPEQIFRISQQHMRDLRALKNREAVAGYLAHSLNRFTDLVFGMVGAKHSAVMRSALEYISANYTRNLSLGEVAAQVGYSPAYFSRIFKEEMGSTFKEYLSSLRIEKSKNLLLGGPISVAEVCHLVGFNDESYFCKTFRSITGVSPDKFRKRLNRIDPEKEHGLK